MNTSSIVFVAVLFLPFVSLNAIYGGFGYNNGFWPQKYFSSVIRPQIYQPIQYVSSAITPSYYDGIKYINIEPSNLNGYNLLNSHIAPQIIYPTVYYNPLPLTPIHYQQSLYSPINQHGFGGYKIFGPGLPTHPGYRPPTMWKRIWPPTNDTDNDLTTNEGTNNEETTTAKSEPIVDERTDTGET